MGLGDGEGVVVGASELVGVIVGRFAVAKGSLPETDWGSEEGCWEGCGDLLGVPIRAWFSSTSVVGVVSVGAALGRANGACVGVMVGDVEGCAEGALDGDSDGYAVGSDDGTTDGSSLGDELGADEAEAS